MGRAQLAGGSKMKINLSPQRRDDTLTIEKNGDRLRINGELFNFGPIPEGGSIDANDVPCEWIVGNVLRTNGEIELTIILPHGSNPPEEMAFPKPLLEAEDGLIDLPKKEELSDVDS